MLTIELTPQQVSLEFGTAAPVEVVRSDAQITVELVTNDGAFVFDVSNPSLEFDAGPTLEMSASVIEISLNDTKGAQGPPGPRQIYLQPDEPAAIPGYDLLWLENGTLGDPLRAIPYIVR